MSAIRYDAGETALVIGLGRSGLASVEVLCARGVTVVTTDEKPLDELREQVAHVVELGAVFVAPGDLQIAIGELDYAVVSPGVPPSAEPARAVAAARIPIVGEIELAYSLCAAPIAAITGTKGKSTTTALIGHLLRGAGKGAIVGGNIGNPLVREVAHATASDWVVAEVSSFQLESTRAFHPRVAVLLNVTEDHLDRYASMDEYAEAKFRIAKNQGARDTFVGNLDDERVRAFGAGDRVVARKRWFSLRESPEAAMFVRDGVVTYAPGGAAKPMPLIACADLPLAGEHNVRNVMAALLTAIAAGCDPIALVDVTRTFKPLAHRLQPIAEIDGVLYVDDSKSTNPESVIAALHAYDRPCVLIAGGRSKGTPFDAMCATIDERAKAAVLIGESAAEIGRGLRVASAVTAASMEDAVAAARELARPGDVVLLSAGCSSFDMFRSAEDRGERFCAAVRALTEATHA